MGAPSPIPPPEQQQQQPWNTHWYGNLAQWIAPAITLLIGIIMISLQVHYRNLDSSTKSSDEHINTLADAKVKAAVQTLTEDIDKKVQPLVPLGEKVSRLDGQVQELRDEVHGLSNNILRQLAPKRSMKSSLIEDRFNQMSRFVEVAFDANLTGNPKKTAVVSNGIEHVLNSRPLPQSTTQAGISAAVHVDGYEAFTRALNAGTKGMALSGGILAGRQPIDKNFIVGIGVLSKEEARPVYDARIKDLWQDLHWIPWIHVTFEHDKILYVGDDLFLADVTFKDCDFMPPEKWPIRLEPLGDQKQQELAMEVRKRLEKANNGPPINVLVVNGKVFF